MTDQIKLPIPKLKSGDHVWYVADKDLVIENAHVCGWKVETWSHGRSMIYYTLEYTDPRIDDEDQSNCACGVPENRLYANELDARRKQLELWSSEHTKQQDIMEDLDRLRAEIMQKILVLEQEENK